MLRKNACDNLLLGARLNGAGFSYLIPLNLTELAFMSYLYVFEGGGGGGGGGEPVIVATFNPYAAGG